MIDINILGASGSIGKQTIDLIKQYRNKFRLNAISVGENILFVEELIEEFNLELICVKFENDKIILERKYKNIKFVFGDIGLIEVAKYKQGLLVNALIGFVGLIPTINAIENKQDICLANKESLVTAGHIIIKKAKENNVNVIPIDSEHSAIMQCFESNNKDNIEKIIITASGGSFREKTRDELKDVTVENALNHPNWKMGKKITIDSATMMNKGLEVIEAKWLFDIEIDKIQTILHKESIVHSMVEYIDGSVITHMGNPDMRTPILFSLTNPLRFKLNNKKQFNLSEIKSLSFEELSQERFPCLKMCYDAIKIGGIIPTVLNASNEAAVELFLKGKIKFLEIEKIIEDEIYNHELINDPTLEEIILTDKLVKERVLKKYN